MQSQIYQNTCIQIFRTALFVITKEQIDDIHIQIKRRMDIIPQISGEKRVEWITKLHDTINRITKIRKMKEMHLYTTAWINLTNVMMNA